MRSRISLCREATFLTGEDMLQGEVDTTGTGCRGIQWLPAIPDGNGISESSLVESESKFLQREGREPARGSFFLGKVYCTLCRSIDSSSESCCGSLCSLTILLVNFFLGCQLCLNALKGVFRTLLQCRC